MYTPNTLKLKHLAGKKQEKSTKNNKNKYNSGPPLFKSKREGYQSNQKLKYLKYSRF